MTHGRNCILSARCEKIAPQMTGVGSLWRQLGLRLAQTPSLETPDPILFGTAYGCEVLGGSSFYGRLDGGGSEEGKKFEGEQARSIKRR